jgi:hypothetical protein
MVLPVPMVVVTEVLAMLRRDEKRCDFGVSLPCHIIYSHFVDFVNFCCHAQASQLFEPAQASLPHLIATMTKANVVDLSSSDTKALLDTLFMSPACGSPVSHPCMVSGCNSFEDWPESNDMAVSVYAAALSVDASSSHAPTVGDPCVVRKSCIGDSPAHELRSQLTSTEKTWWRKPALSCAPRKRSKKVKVGVERTLEMPASRGGSLSAANFDRSEWKIMYPLFVAEGLVDPSERVSRGNP